MANRSDLLNKYSNKFQVFERAMKFSYEAIHVWQQFGLALACGRHYGRALLVLKEAHRLLPAEPHNCLLAAKICFQNLGKVNITNIHQKMHL